MDVAAIIADPDLARVAADLAGLVRPSIRLMATPISEAALDLFASKLGGHPALPPGVAWPTGRLRVPPPTDAFRRARSDLPTLPPDGIIALPFIAQIRLADLAPHDRERLLPDSGLLSFFYNPVAYWSDAGDTSGVRDNLTGLSYGAYDYDRPANWRVLYHDGDLDRFALAVPPPGLPPPLAYEARTLTFAAEPTLPQVETCFIGDPGGAEGKLALTPDEWEIYVELRRETRANRAIHQMLGHPDGTQPFVMERGYRAIRANFFPELPSAAQQEEAARQAELVAVHLLFQVDDLGGAARFGRDGRLFFFIRDEDLARRDFGKVWVAAP